MAIDEKEMFPWSDGSSKRLQAKIAKLTVIHIIDQYDSGINIVFKFSINRQLCTEEAQQRVHLPNQILKARVMGAAWISDHVLLFRVRDYNV